LYRRSSPAVLRCLSEAVDPVALSFKDAVAAMGSMVGRRADRAPPPFDGGRRRALVQEQRGSGCVPDRCSSCVGFIFCGSNQSLSAKESSLFQICGSRRIDGGGRVGDFRRF
jgi:hypothetical protein